ncbi:MAG: [protein-PII] uridylyltransferase, partial [Actinobacteria bacterium]|nr:[protein-PII] uridylyltransferase [Actinomycetota bacterium]
MRSLASSDLRVALGLLDGRMIWGDEKFAESNLERVRSMWQLELGAQWIPELRRQMAQRHADAGELAFLLEPDLKEAHGGLRDVSVLSAVASYAAELADYVDLSTLSDATALLTAVR